MRAEIRQGGKTCSLTYIGKAADALVFLDNPAPLDNPK